MKNKLYLVLFLVLLLGATSYGQPATATLATVTAVPGTNIVVPLTVTNFPSIGAITMKIKFTKFVLTFINLTNDFPGFAPLVGSTDSTVSIVWSSTTPITIISGTLCNLNFQYNGTPTALTFFNCQVSYGFPPTDLPVTYTNGAVNPDQTLPNHAQIGTRSASTSSPVSVPLYYPGFTVNAAGITQKIQYDPTKLTFTSITPMGHLTGALGGVSGGVLTITWTNTLGSSISSPGDSILLNFIYIGNTPAPLTFYPGCVISNTVGGNIPVSYFNGVVNPIGPTGTATLGTISSCENQVGEYVEIPLDFSTFPSNVTAFTLNITYPVTKLAYITTVVLNPIGTTLVNQTSGNINIAWTSPAGSPINGTFMKFRFRYTGITQANVNFGTGLSFTVFPSLTVTVTYNNGFVNPIIPTGNDATIGYTNGTSGNTVLIPISFANLPTNIGAVTLFANFDPAKLTFIDAPVNPFGATAFATASQVGISWVNPFGSNINGSFITLRFMYTCGGSDCGANLTFTDGCEITDITTHILCMDWHNGGVNLNFMVSGTLKYNSDPNTRIPLSGFTVSLKTDPGNVTVGSSVTNASGFYSILAPNGTYKLVATAPITVCYADLPDALALFNYTLLGTIPNDTPDHLRVLAGDVAAPLNGFPDLVDVLAIFNWTVSGVKPVNFIAPPWVFQSPSVVINSAAQTKDFMGLNSGNVLGSNPTP